MDLPCAPGGACLSHSDIAVGGLNDMRFILATMAAAILTAPAAAQEVSRSEINFIVNEGMNQSEVMEIAAHLTDRIGGRMTNSPQMRQAERWTQQRFRDWGLTNVHAEGFEFGRGWSINRASARMTAPRPLDLKIIPVAWTPGTTGPVSAGIVVAPMEKERDFDKWRGRLRGKIVLVSYPGTGSEPTTAPFKRLEGEDFTKLSQYKQPKYSPAAIEKMLSEVDFDEKLDAFLKAEGAVAWVRMSGRDAGLLHGEGYGYERGRTPALPGIEMAAEDYRRLTRLARTDAPPTLEINSDVNFHDEDVNAYNIIADIAGTDPAAGYVMAGAHFDSWSPTPPMPGSIPIIPGGTAGRSLPSPGTAILPPISTSTTARERSVESMRRAMRRWFRSSRNGFRRSAQWAPPPCLRKPRAAPIMSSCRRSEFPATSSSRIRWITRPAPITPASTVTIT
jgi:hypothetical protein